MRKRFIYKVTAVILTLTLGTLIFSGEIISSAETASETDFGEISARSAVLMNASTGGIVYARNPGEVRAMASVTKIMTTLLTIESGESGESDFDTPFTVDSEAVCVEGSSMGLCPGDVVSKRDLCYGMMLPSGNDSANAAAVAVSGNIAGFVALMNSRAAELGLSGTRFANPHGLDEKNHYSTAYDLAVLTRFALRNATFREICGTRSAKITFRNQPYPHNLHNNNKLLRMYDGCIGVKTGFTDNARRCLVSAAERNGVTLIAVTLSAADDWNDHIKMFDYGFGKVTNRVLPLDLSGITVSSPEKSENNLSINVVPENPLTFPLTEEEAERITFRTATRPFAYGKNGSPAGEISLFLDGEVLMTEQLVTAE
ncbi:D-alanyl-D-alanine carboxypeptidase [Clostridia bacterium]|nr:D-alanyl-D-alanine carboxypeptidase [Clostridia bacterium]